MSESKRYINEEFLKCIQLVGKEIRKEDDKKESQDDCSTSAKVNVANCETKIINYCICTLYKWIVVRFGIKLSDFFKRVEDKMEQRAKQKKEENKNQNCNTN